jgi:ribonuclease HI
MNSVAVQPAAPPNAVQLWCDGSFRPPTAGGWGAYLIYPGARKRSHPRFLGSVSVNDADEAELIAALEGLRRIEDGMTVHVYSDNQLVRRVLADLVRVSRPRVVSGVGENSTRAHRKHGKPHQGERWADLCGKLLNELARFPAVRACDAHQEPGRLGVVHRLARLGSGLCKELQRANASVILGHTPTSSCPDVDAGNRPSRSPIDLPLSGERDS